MFLYLSLILLLIFFYEGTKFNFERKMASIQFWETTSLKSSEEMTTVSQSSLVDAGLGHRNMDKQDKQ